MRSVHLFYCMKLLIVFSKLYSQVILLLTNIIRSPTKEEFDKKLCGSAFGVMPVYNPFSKTAKLLRARLLCVKSDYINRIRFN